MKEFLLAVILMMYGVSISAQSVLPPAFKMDNNAYQARKDELTRVFISPVRIVWTYKGEEGTLVQHEENLLGAGNSQTNMGRENCCLLTSTEKQTASILLDFGREIHGGLQMVMGSGSRREPSLVRIRFGESVGEANSQTNNSEWKVGYSTDDHAKRDMILEIPRDGLIEVGNTGFRFVRIDLLQKNTTVSVKEIRAVLRYRDIPYLGSFHSSDERLNRIWMTGAYTVHLNMQEYLWDGIKRDRLVWLGDMHPELMSIIKVFGYNEVIPKSLDLACEQFPLPKWMNNMSAYSLWYLIIQHDWYMQNADMAFLKKHQPYITGLIRQIDSKIDAEGNENLSSRRFLDWPSSTNAAGVEAGYRALISWALTDAAKLCRILGDNQTAEISLAAKERLNRKIKGHNNLKQAASLMSIAGLIDPQKAADEVISVGGSEGFSTFYGYYMLEGLALSGDYDMAVKIIDEYWGGMLDMGATTFWEDFDLKWTENAARLDEMTPEGKKDIHGDFGAYCYPGYRHSLCHGWSSGPTAWLSEHVLGVKIVDPGCKTVKIEPHIGSLKWVEGTIPTPAGVIKVKHTRKDDGTISSEITLPKGVKVSR